MCCFPACVYLVSCWMSFSIHSSDVQLLLFLRPWVHLPDGSPVVKTISVSEYLYMHGVIHFEAGWVGWCALIMNTRHYQTLTTLLIAVHGDICHQTLLDWTCSLSKPSIFDLNDLRIQFLHETSTNCVPCCVKFVLPVEISLWCDWDIVSVTNKCHSYVCELGCDAMEN